MKNILTHNRPVQIVLALIILIGIIWGGIALFGGHTDNFSTVSVVKKDITQSVRATGTVAPDQEVQLAFDMQGKVTSVNVQTGDIVHQGDSIASLDSGTLQAQIDGATADVMSAQANLSTAQRGARPEEVALYQQKYTDASNALVVAMKNAYLQSSDAIIGKADSFFINGNTANPIINIRTQSTNEQISIQQERLSIHDTLNSWQTVLSTLSAPYSTSTLETVRSTTANNLTAIKSFIDHIMDYSTKY